MGPAPPFSKVLQSLPFRMKKKAQSGDAGKGTRKVSGPDKGPRLIPSRTWGQGARALWRSLAFRERAVIVMGVFVPALDQISRLVSLGVMMKAVSRGIRQPLDLDSRIWLGLVILVAAGVAALIQLFSTKVKKDLKIQLTKIIRRSYGRMMVATDALSVDERKAEVQYLVNEERNFMSSAMSGASTLVEFVASIMIVFALLIVLTWFNWIVGAIILSAGLSALLILRLRIRKNVRQESDLGDERKKVTRILEGIAESGKNRKTLIEDYTNNQFDFLTFAEQEAKSSLERRISTAMNFGSAILMAVVFLLVSSQGAFDENKMVWMVVFVFGLRMVVSNGKTAMLKWSGVLGEKKSLMALAKASLSPSLNQNDGNPDDCTNEDQEVGPVLKEGPGPRIVDYSFCGLDGGELVSREPLVVEMVVETEEEIEGFYWSFAITRLAGPPYLISKTSEDSGINWNLPSGRSRFRMVTGPIWLPPGDYSIMVGIAQGNRLLDLVGSEESRLTISVLPDESAKRSVQKRIAADVVAVDVEWQLEFRHENLEPAVSPPESLPAF